jgi:hypothetical protein
MPWGKIEEKNIEIPLCQGLMAENWGIGRNSKICLF